MKYIAQYYPSLMKVHFLNCAKSTLFICVLTTMFLQHAFAQAPEKMSYQAVIRTSSNALVLNQNVGMRVSILQGTPGGSAVYIETHVAMTNQHGLVGIEIGTGNIVSGVFADIDWANGLYFLKSETDPTGGTNYTITGVSQLISVPYALHAKRSDNGVPNSTGHNLVLTLCHGVPTWTSGGICPTTENDFPVGAVHCNPSNLTQIVDVVNPVTNRTWMDRNLGANRAAISTSDAQAFGSLYQWGRGSDGHQCVNRYSGDGVATSSTTPTLSNTDNPGHGMFIFDEGNLGDWRENQNNSFWQGMDGINNPCPTGYRIPTINEWHQESQSWAEAPVNSGINGAGAFSSFLKLTMAGSRNYATGSIQGVISQGIYASSSISGGLSYALQINNTGTQVNPILRAYGNSVRCIKHLDLSSSLMNYPNDYAHCDGSSPTEIVDVLNPVTSVTWMDRNLGANRAAQSETDNQSYGSLFQWGRSADGHQCVNRFSGDGISTSVSTPTLSSGDSPGHNLFIIVENSIGDWRENQNTNFWQGVSGTNNPCPNGYRLPTITEWNNERSSWTQAPFFGENNASGAFSSALKLSKAGVRNYSNGAINGVETNGVYASSTMSGTNSSALSFDNSNAENINIYRAHGFSVRCLKEGTSVGSIGSINCGSSTNNGTLTAGVLANGVSSSVTYTGGNGGLHNGQSVSSTGVTGLTASVWSGSFDNGSGTLTYTISGTPYSAGTASFALNIGGQTCVLNLSVQIATSTSYPAGYTHCNSSNPTAVVEVINPVTGETWMDRNLGANRAAMSSMDTESYGSLFQWGRGADGHQCVQRYSGDGVTTSGSTTTLSTTDAPGHGNFIIAADMPFDWRNPQNGNLWQGVNGANNPCPIGFRIPTESEWNNERLSWTQAPINSTNNASGAFASPLKLPVAGGRVENFLFPDGSNGNYWSSTTNGNNSNYLKFSSIATGLDGFNRAYGLSVRCIKD